MHAFEKNRGVGIWGQYFSERMETTSTKEKGNKRKECRNIVQNPYFFQMHA